MNRARTVLALAFIYTFLVCLPSATVATASSTDSSMGFCCKNKKLQQVTEKQCTQVKGTFYPQKEKVTAQKECATSAPLTSSAIDVGFCCDNGDIQKVTRAECMKKKGDYYPNSTLAKKQCKPESIFCCNNGKLTETSRSECSKHKGVAYSNAITAKKKCKAVSIYCCENGKLVKSSTKQCQQRKGAVYSTLHEAKRNCTPSKVHCCIDGSITVSAKQECAQRRGIPYKTAAEAKRRCKAKEIYCCIDGTIKRTSSKKCRSQQGKEFLSRLLADKTCKSNALQTRKPPAAGRNFTPSIVANKADLVVIKASSLLVDEAGNATIEVTIKNTGAAITPRSSSQLVLRGITNKSTLPNTLSTEIECPSLKAGEEYTLDWIIKKRALVSAESYTVSIWLDNKNLIDEQNERNNHVTQPLQLIQHSWQDQGTVHAAVAVKPLPQGTENLPKPRLSPGISDVADIGRVAGGPNWTTLSGVVSNEARDAIFPDLNHVSAQRIGSVSPKRGYRNFTTPEINGMAYSLSLPPSSTWMIQPVVDKPHLFNEIQPFQITTSAEGGDITRHIVISLKEDYQSYFQDGEWCTFTGRVTFNGYAPTENLQIRLTSNDSAAPVGSWPLAGDGTFSFEVPPGYYTLQPYSLNTTAYDNTIAPQEYLCSPGLERNIVADFNYETPELCSVAGYAFNNGKADGQVRSLTLRTADSSMEPFTIDISPAGTYHVDLPTGKSYTLILNVPEHWETPPRRAFRINAGETTKTINFELLQPEFQIGEITDMRVTTNPGGMAPSIKIFFEANLIGGSQEKYPQAIRITSPTRSDMEVISTCFFAPNGICNTKIWTGEFDVRRDSLHAQIVDLENIPGTSKDWALPFKDITGDLTLHHGGHLLIERPQDRARIEFGVLNLGPLRSEPCDMSIKINHRTPAVIPIPSLNPGQHHVVSHTEATHIDTGDEIVFQINNQCDKLTTNNEVSLVIQDHNQVGHPDHDVEDTTEHVRMTGESSSDSFWDWLF